MPKQIDDKFEGKLGVNLDSYVSFDLKTPFLKYEKNLIQSSIKKNVTKLNDANLEQNKINLDDSGNDK